MQENVTDAEQRSASRTSTQYYDVIRLPSGVNLGSTEGLRQIKQLCDAQAAKLEEAINSSSPSDELISQIHPLETPIPLRCFGRS